MLDAYGLSDNGPQTINPAEGGTVPDGARWIDLNHPTREEDRAAEQFLRASLPTREEALAQTVTLILSPARNLVGAVKGPGSPAAGRPAGPRGRA